MNRTQIVIVRHGQTEWNIRGIRQGYLDSPLTARGMAQAKALAQRLAREKFTALYSSDLGRAVQTAQEIADVTGHTIVTDARLRERHLGILQGLNAEEIMRSIWQNGGRCAARGLDMSFPAAKAWFSRSSAIWLALTS